jgi:diguanylate cyclase (GGDEF)-like protein/PAS domain S-box-containing protein
MRQACPKDELFGKVRDVQGLHQLPPDELQVIVDAESDAQILLRVDEQNLTVVTANSTAESVFGLHHVKPEPHLSDIVPDDVCPALVDACRSVWETGQPQDLDDINWQRGNARPKWLNLRVRRLYGLISLECRDVSQWHRSREQLKVSQAHYRMLAEYSSDVVFASTDGVLSWVSPSVKSVLGWKPSDMVGKHISGFLHPDDLALSASAAKDLATGHAARYEARFKHRRNGWVWLAITARPQFDDRGRIIGRIGSGRDISSRIVAEQALQESERQVRDEREALRAVLDSSLDPQVVLQSVQDDAGAIVDFRFTDCNRAATAYLRTSRRGLIGKRLADLFPGPAQDLTSSWMRQVATSGRPFFGDQIELFPTLTGGEQRWFDISITQLVQGVTFTWRDVTDAVVGSKALADSEELFRLTAEHSPVALCLIAPNGGFITVNRALCELLGRNEQTLRESTWQELTHAEDLDVDLDLVQDVLEGRRDSYRLTKRYLRPDGGVVWGDLSVSCVREPDGQVRYFISQILDITELVEQRQAMADSEKHYRLLAENTADVVATVDARGCFEWVSPSVGGTFGWDPEELQGTRIGDFIDSKDWTRIEAVMSGNQPGMQMSGMFRARRRDGSYIWVDASASTTVDANGSTLHVARLRNVDSEFRAQQRVRASEERFRTAMNSSPVGTALVDAQGLLVQVNDALCRLLGFTEQELLTKRLPDLCEACGSWDDVLAGHTWSGEGQLLAADGSRIWVQQALAPVTDDDGERTSVVAQFIDVTQARQARALLEFQANHDPLTSLKNRRAVMAAMAATLAHPPRSGSRGLAVLYCDLDLFKPVNDQFGHAPGDQLLTEVGRRIRRCVRVGDTVGRIGGDEFVVLLMDVHGYDDASRVAESVRAAVAEPLDVNDLTLNVTMSVGIALAEADEEPDDVLAKADQALYEAKRRGRNQVVRFGQ